MPVAFGQLGRTNRAYPMSALGMRRRRYRVAALGLGALSPEQATNQVFPSSKITGTAGQNQAVWNAIQSSASAGEIIDSSGNPAYTPGTADCAQASGGISTGTVTLDTIAATAGKIAPLTGPAAPFVAIGAGIVGLFGSIFQAHSKAVQHEQDVLCTAVPAANNYLSLIQQAVSSGQSTPQQGIQALQSLQSDFQSTVGSIFHGAIGTSSCNAACVMAAELQAICLVLSSQFQDLANSQAAAATAASTASSAAAASSAPSSASTSTPSVSQILSAPAAVVNSVAASTGLPAWALYAAAGLLFLFLV